MRFNKNLAAIHGYLCGDGYVITNPPTQKHKYYHIGFRNTNDVLLKDFQQKFKEVFGLTPIITNEGRCRIQNKEIYHLLTKECSYYSYEWRLPQLSKENIRHWLRAFFDCEGWVENQPAKSRLIGLDCCNESGLRSVQEALKKFKIYSSIKRKRTHIWRLTICDIKNLKRFQKQIGFLHPEKARKLEEAINSYKNYKWGIPTDKQGLLQFLKEKGRYRGSRKELRIFSIKKQNLTMLNKALNMHSIVSNVHGPWVNNNGSKYYCLIIKEDMNGQKYREAQRDNAGD